MIRRHSQLCSSLTEITKAAEQAFESERSRTAWPHLMRNVGNQS
jgi:hypothetical protein